jgi:UDP-glucose 6-dehydrogenase
MLKNGWINSMHTQVPGPDGNVSYGGLCFPKDTTALLHFMESLDVPCEVIKATVEERNEMRKGEDDNIIKE